MEEWMNHERTKKERSLQERKGEKAMEWMSNERRKNEREKDQMVSKISENNIASLTGTIISDFVFSHETYGEKFYTVDVKIERKSGYEDVIPVLISERLTDTTSDLTGMPIVVKGEFRSYNKHEAGHNRLILSMFAKEAKFLGNDEVDDFIRTRDNNSLELEGFICKEPVFRKTPLGREITDVIVAVKRRCGRSDYIPCICWGCTAKLVSGLSVGTCIKLKGRMQSRPYVKKIGENEVENRMAYEVSVSVVHERQNVRQGIGAWEPSGHNSAAPARIGICGAA